MSRPDSGYSWVIALCCCYIHFALFGLFRSSGVMYVALLQNFGASREAVSWPFSLCSAVFQLTAPVASIATSYISQRSTCLLGSGIATLGLVCCFFANDMLWINIFYGIVHGLGFGIAVTLVPVVVSQYFVKHRATAIGIAFSGGTVGSLILPRGLEFLLDIYGLRGCYLLLGGIVMNTLVASALLRAPPWLKKEKLSAPPLLQEHSEARDSGVSTSDEHQAQVNEESCVNDSGPQAGFEPADERERIGGDSGDGLEIAIRPDVETANADDANTDFNRDTIYSNNDSVLFGGSNVKLNAINSPQKPYGDKADYELQAPLMKTTNVFIIPKQENAKKDIKPKRKCYHSVLEILKNPMFHVITISMGAFFLGVHSFFMVIVDFAKDKGIPEAEGSFIVSMFSLTDFFGRAGLGWVTDRSYIKRKNMVILDLIIIGVLNQLYPFVDSLNGILIIAGFHGLAVGSCISLFFILQVEYMGLQRLTLVVSLTSFINGLLTFARPSMTGLFRDVIGSYDWMFHFLGILVFFVALLWLTEPWIIKNISKRTYASNKQEVCD